MKASELTAKYLQFFQAKGHAIISSAPLKPENDPTVLFTTAGMHPLVPYLLGQPHPAGKRLVDIQKCVRTDDIDEVGDATHHTMFFMLGNWSLGDYFKKEAIAWSWEFLTDKKWLALDAQRISVTCFEGDKDAPKDTESAQHWESVGVPKERIFFKGKKDNWWGPAGKTGPCGPDTEMFYDTLKQKCGAQCEPGCSCGKYVEIWNDVFMQYLKDAEGKFSLLKQQTVDTGMGLERTTAALQGKESAYDTELFSSVMNELRTLSDEHNKANAQSMRIISDHLRSAVFILAERIAPSNVEHGYVLRRLIRRAIRHAYRLGIKQKTCAHIGKMFIELYGKEWKELKASEQFILAELEKEELKFLESMENGMREFARMTANANSLDGEQAFLLFQSYGFPLEMTRELAKEKNVSIDEHGFEEKMREHQELSRKGTEKKFASGLADHHERTIRMHTATHLLQASLRKVLGKHVQQKGSNITQERLRFDFSHPQKMTPEEIKAVEDLVNQQIQRELIVTRKEETLKEAQDEGAIAFFDDKYPEQMVSVYTMGDFSKEVCTGPHVQNTKEVGQFKIQKEEGVSAGIRRIKATVMP